MVRGRSVFARDDTFFGVCEAIGEDFGFNPTFLRILFALGLFVDPIAAPAAYVACGALVLLSRRLVPEPGEVAAEAADAASNDDERQAQAWEELALAA